jgi:hypothetical protein
LNSNTRHFGSFTFISVLSCKTKWSIPWFDTGDGRIGRVLKTKVDGLLVIWPQNHWDGFLQFGLKTGGDGFLRFGLATGGDGFLLFNLKTDGSSFPV